jgi:hypothetical protein
MPPMMPPELFILSISADTENTVRILNSKNRIPKQIHAIFKTFTGIISPPFVYIVAEKIIRDKP